MTRISFLPHIVMTRNSWNLVLLSAVTNCFRSAEFVKTSNFEEIMENEFVS